MMNPWRLLACAAVVSGTLGVGVGSAQTVTVTNAPAGSTVELVLNDKTLGSAPVDAAGYASIPVNLEKTAGKPETDVYVFIDVCGSVRRVILAERGQQPGPIAADCERRDMGLFLLRRSSSVIVNVGGVNPTVLLVQGRYDPRNPRPMRAWNAAPTGLVLSAAGGLMRFSNVETQSCGNVSNCEGGGFGIGYTLGATYWIKPYLAAEAGFVRPQEVTIEGSGSGFQFTTSLDPRVFTIAGKAGAPLGPVRVYGKGGGTLHQATYLTTQTNDPTTVTIDGVSQTIPGGTQTFELKTEGWGWFFGGGMEVWMKRWFAAYAEANFMKLKGSPVDDSEGAFDDRLMVIVLGGRIHIGR